MNCNTTTMCVYVYMYKYIHIRVCGISPASGLSRSSCRTITLHERVLCSLVTLVLDSNSTGVQDLLVQVYFFPALPP